MRKRAAESRFGTVSWSAPPLKKLKVVFNPEGNVEISQHYYIAPAKTKIIAASFKTLNEAIRGQIESAESERARMAETRRIAFELSRIRGKMEALGSGSTVRGSVKWKRREELAGRLQAILESMEPKKRALKVQAKGLLIPHVRLEEVRTGALELLEKGNWPAAQACISTMLPLLKRENEYAARDIIPVIGQREDALRAYKSNHLFYIGKALELMKSAETLPADERAAAVREAAKMLDGLEYLHSKSVRLRLSQLAPVIGRVAKAEHARRALAQPRRLLEETISRLNRTDST
ncbi:hypothetical protein COU36_00225 [Candidatus Micrarchaeota archaeon CG10_big_fil_rev_8_21_14_0_10_59_7]|nr:MAG: hypothetical protein COU36_00225 [Candidatus Micrarchaeota archaeon CG10_big_fil_rev_8_21_14_0_10_59_7]